MDQSLALRWVHENSNFFGGDANRITLVGVSPGAASVQYHYLSAMSEGLFNNGISLSSTVLAPWRFSHSPQKALKTLLVLRCSDEDSVQIIECIKNMPAYTLYNATKFMLSKFEFPYFLYLPVAENTSENFYIDRELQEISESGHVYNVPWITGVVSEEGLFSFAELLANNELTAYVNNHWDQITSYMLGDLKDIKTLAHSIGDSLFLTAGEKAAKLQASVNKSPVRFYYDIYGGAHSVNGLLASTTKNLGVHHGDDAFSVFEMVGYDPRRTAEDKAMSNKLLNFWYFVAAQNYNSSVMLVTGQVNADSELFSYLAIKGSNNVHIKSDNNFGNKTFWTSIEC